MSGVRWGGAALAERECLPAVLAASTRMVDVVAPSLGHVCVRACVLVVSAPVCLAAPIATLRPEHPVDIGVPALRARNLARLQLSHSPPPAQPSRHRRERCAPADESGA